MLKMKGLYTRRTFKDFFKYFKAVSLCAIVALVVIWHNTEVATKKARYRANCRIYSVYEYDWCLSIIKKIVLRCYYYWRHSCLLDFLMLQFSYTFDLSMKTKSCKHSCFWACLINFNLLTPTTSACSFK